MLILTNPMPRARLGIPVQGKMQNADSGIILAQAYSYVSFADSALPPSQFFKPSHYVRAHQKREANSSIPTSDRGSAERWRSTTRNIIKHIPEGPPGRSTGPAGRQPLRDGKQGYCGAGYEMATFLQLAVAIEANIAISSASALSPPAEKIRTRIFLGCFSGMRRHTWQLRKARPRLHAKVEMCVGNFHDGDTSNTKCTW
jgi:hypothetical protein